MAKKNYRAELIFLFGDPVDDNPTGVVEEAAFAAANLNYRYVTCRVARGDIADAVRGMRVTNARGANLTMPHKVDVLPYLDEIGASARIIGAVNTIVNRDGRFYGENTDGRGFVRSLTDVGIDLRGKTLTILGAGGAARAIGAECALAGAVRIHVVNRDAGRGESLVNVINANTAARADYIPWVGTARVPGDTDILVNATCVGLMPDPEAFPDIEYADIRADMIACDVVFNPAVTAFMRRAAAQGARTVDGLGMLANQGALNFELWTGVDAPRAVMLDALKKEFESV